MAAMHEGGAARHDVQEAFERDGLAVVQGFASDDECDAMRARMAQLLSEWDSTQQVTAFSTAGDQEEAQGKSSYFLDSADRIHFFLEPAATAEDGVSLKEGCEKYTAINKVGHGLHVADPVFREYAESDKVRQLTRALGWKAPVLPQSMYIFKQPKIGGEVTSHQDSTFLYTTPRPTCLGMWLALEDATLENGCLWGRMGSHKEPVRRVFARNPEHFNGNPNAPMMIFETLVSEDNTVPWEGTIPSNESSNPHLNLNANLQGDACADRTCTSRVATHHIPGIDDSVVAGVEAAGFQPLPVKKGDLVLIHGQVDHLSLPNVSGKSRHTFQLHLVEGPTEGITWSPRNWLQYPEGHTFPKL
eukprot:m.197644 g.197644  ORF g.197644 m.197644 type:complete len:359 (+) comp20183_c0_seq1:112-1188(+)